MKPLHQGQADFFIQIDQMNRSSRQDENGPEEVYHFEYSMEIEIANGDSFQKRTIKVLSYPLTIV